MPPPTLGGLQVLDLLAALRAVGLDVDAACRRLGLARFSPTEGARVDSRTVAALFAEAESRFADPLVGLHAGDRCQPRGVLNYLVTSSPRLEDGLRQAARFAGLLITGLRVEVGVRGDRFGMTYHFDDRRILAIPHLVDYLLLASLRGLQRAAAGEVRPCEVHLPRAARGGAAEATRLFGCPVLFDRPHAQLVFSRRALQAAGRSANPLIARQIEQFAASLLADVTLRRRFATA